MFRIESKIFNIKKNYKYKSKKRAATLEMTQV